VDGIVDFEANVWKASGERASEWVKAGDYLRIKTTEKVAIAECKTPGSAPLKVIKSIGKATLRMELNSLKQRVNASEEAATVDSFEWLRFRFLRTAVDGLLSLLNDAEEAFFAGLIIHQYYPANCEQAPKDPVLCAPIVRTQTRINAFGYISCTARFVRPTTIPVVAGHHRQRKMCASGTSLLANSSSL
jgi:hypothetical protein